MSEPEPSSNFPVPQPWSEQRSLVTISRKTLYWRLSLFWYRTKPILVNPMSDIYGPSWLSCSSCPILSQLSSSGCPVLSALFRLSCSGFPVPNVLFRMSCSGCPVPEVLFPLSCSRCPVPAVLFPLSFSSSLFRLSWTGCLGPAVLRLTWFLHGILYMKSTGIPQPSDIDKNLIWISKRGSDIRLSPISLVTDIRQIVNLWQFNHSNFTRFSLVRQSP
jgi:hypothetical protein